MEAHGWMAIKLIQTNTNGIPDLMCLREGQCVFVEVKAKGKKSSPLQVYVQEKLRNAGVNVFETSNPDFLI
jgi:Holliday junction resolvase